MTSLLAAVALSDVLYKVTPTTRAEYSVQVVFDGFLPLLGGNQGKAQVDMDVTVHGLEAKGNDLQAKTNLKAFTISFNGAPLPLDVNNARSYFPETTVQFTPQGTVTANSAPDIDLPVKLPGLDVKRMPDITFLPIELPKEAKKTGETWTFKRSFGGSDITYTCTMNAVDATSATVGVKIRQEYTVLENDLLEVVTDRAEAAASVKTVMTGTGTVVYDVKLGLARSVRMNNSSISTVTPIAAGVKAEERKLDSSLKVDLTSPKSSVAPVKESTSGGTASGGGTQSVLANWMQQGRNLWGSVQAYWQLAKFGVQAAMRFVPGGENLLPFLNRR